MDTWASLFIPDSPEIIDCGDKSILGSHSGKNRIQDSRVMGPGDDVPFQGYITQ
jgi:hypothetical protein